MSRKKISLYSFMFLIVAVFSIGRVGLTQSPAKSNSKKLDGFTANNFDQKLVSPTPVLVSFLNTVGFCADSMRYQYSTTLNNAGLVNTTPCESLPKLQLSWYRLKDTKAAHVRIEYEVRIGYNNERIRLRLLGETVANEIDNGQHVTFQMDTPVDSSGQSGKIRLVFSKQNHRFQLYGNSLLIAEGQFQRCDSDFCGY